MNRPLHFRISSMPSLAARGLIDARADADGHVFMFYALSSEPPADWFVAQFEAMTDADFAINCLTCPEQGEPTSVGDPDGD